jgi:transposase-like protein
MEHCNKPMKKHGRPNGIQRWKCKVCNHTQLDSDRPVGRPCEGVVPLTQVEKNQRYRDANRTAYRAAQKARRDAKKLKEVSDENIR